MRLSLLQGHAILKEPSHWAGGKTLFTGCRVENLKATQCNVHTNEIPPLWGPKYFRWRATFDNPSFMKDVRPVTDIHDFRCVMLREQPARAPTRKPADHRI